MTKRVSVVIATYNRGVLLLDLLRDLAAQQYPAEKFEVVVVDDGSKEPVEPLCATLSVPYAFKITRQKNAGPAAARHHGVGLAEGEIIVITDDDMRLGPDFLSQHVQAHDKGATVVLGNIAPAPNLQKMPIFERFHAHQLDAFVKAVRAGTEVVRGTSVCTGNVSFRRDEYMRLGGFDTSLGRSEDRELGVRFEKNGGKLVFVEAAKSVHGSDHADLRVWMKRAYNYGIYDRRIALKHPDIESADPWRFWFLINPISRALMAVPLVSPAAGDLLAKLVMRSAMATDQAGFENMAIKGTTLGYGLEYFRGLRQDAGSLRLVARDVRGYLRKRTQSPGGRA